jgi:hypothetical protein
MTGPEETFIVRVRRGDDRAVVEQPRLGRRLIVHDVSAIGTLVRRWAASTAEPPQREVRPNLHAEKEERTT